MKERLSLQYSFELIFALISFAAVIAVLQTFVIGQHYIIPSVILVIAVVTGNLAWYGFLIRKILDHVNSRAPPRLPPRRAESHQTPPDLFAER